MDKKKKTDKLVNIVSQLGMAIEMGKQGKDISNMLISLQDQVDEWADDACVKDMKDEMKGEE